MIQVTKVWSLAALTVLTLLVSFHAHSSVIYNYTGNPFTESASGMIGNWIVASVTFSDPPINSSFTGDVYEGSVSGWSIQVAQLPNSKLDNANAWHDQRPLWFHFENGIITGWQLLAAPVNQGLPELYTTNNSIYPSICPTCDYYRADLGNNYAINYNQSGSWSAVPVPIPATLWLFSSALAGWGFIGKSRSARK